MAQIAGEVSVTPQQIVTDVSGYWSTTDKAIEMFPVSLAVCVSNEIAMQKAVSETNGSVQDTEAAMRGDASVTEACVLFLMGICLGALP